jgi:SAM-dependent methyltransferase
VCAICGPGVAASTLYRANFAESDLTPGTFSARRLPDRVHYRIVRCARCGLVRSDPVLDVESLRQFYEESSFDYAAEVGGLRFTYRRYLAQARRLGGDQASLLEVGSGNGFFLLEALRMGYSVVRGVEPSTAAVDAADPEVRPYLVRDIMHSGLFEDGTFDAVCMFQVLDHLPDPGAVLDACLRVLRPGGVLLCINHNVAAFSARILKERSPIIDIEHTYLYDHATMRQVFTKHGYLVLEQGGVINALSLSYLMHLLPLPRWLRRSAAGLLRALRMSDLRFQAPLGNLYLIGQRPTALPS